MWVANRARFSGKWINRWQLQDCNVQSKILMYNFYLLPNSSLFSQNFTIDSVIKKLDFFVTKFILIYFFSLLMRLKLK